MRFFHQWPVLKIWTKLQSSQNSLVQGHSHCQQIWMWINTEFQLFTHKNLQVTKYFANHPIYQQRQAVVEGMKQCRMIKCINSNAIRSMHHIFNPYLRYSQIRWWIVWKRLSHCFFCNRMDVHIKLLHHNRFIDLCNFVLICVCFSDSALEQHPVPACKQEKHIIWFQFWILLNCVEW